MGATPLTALAVLCYPDAELPPEALRDVLRGGEEKMREAGVSILGGHSVRDPELKFGYSVTGRVRRRQLLTNAGARPGDRLILTKPLGTGVLSTALKHGHLETVLARRLTRQMATLNRSASEAAVRHGASALTDVTGFGLLGHGAQLADASGVSLRLHPDRSWFLPRVLDLVTGEAPAGLHHNREFYGQLVAENSTPETLALALYDPQTSGG